MRLDTITLDSVLPLVFSGDTLPSGSQVWQTSLTLRRPDHYLVAAESGAGKSSLCSFIYGNRHDYAGDIRFNGEDIRGYDTGRWAEIRTRSLALLPQELRLFPELTAIDNILLKNRLTDYKTEAEIGQMLQTLEIDNKADQLAGLLSVGQQQRVAIVRSLCQPFDFLLLDEPVSHLDPRNNQIAADLIAAEAHRQDAAIISTSVGNPLLLPAPITLKL